MAMIRLVDGTPEDGNTWKSINSICPLSLNIDGPRPRSYMWRHLRAFQGKLVHDYGWLAGCMRTIGVPCRRRSQSRHRARRPRPPSAVRAFVALPIDSYFAPRNGRRTTWQLTIELVTLHWGWRPAARFPRSLALARPKMTMY